MTLFLAGDVAFRHVLRISPLGYRAAAAALALAAWPVAASASAATAIVLLTAIGAAALAAEGRAGHATVEP